LIDSRTIDVINCFANLSSDEVFTPPALANKILDLLPVEIFTSKKSKFLDPSCKSGVFLREIAKRLILGLEAEIPDKTERIEHIFKNMLFGISLTGITSLMTRRTLYCTKDATSPYSIVKFDSVKGNVIYNNTEHKFIKNICQDCGLRESMFKEIKLDTDNYAYDFIHDKKLKEELKNMNFDVIIGNPPYQLSDGAGGKGGSAKPIYQHFVDQAISLNPRYISMIIPTRWVLGGKGLDEFREKMLHDDRLRVMYDYTNAKDCFPGVEIKGGVMYFLWERDRPGLCNITTQYPKGKIKNSIRPLLENKTDTFIRHSDAVSIVRKCNSKSYVSEVVFSRNPFGLKSNFNNYEDSEDINNVKVYGFKTVRYVKKTEIKNNSSSIDKYKIYIPKAFGNASIENDKIKPILGYPGTACTETYLMIGPFTKKRDAENFLTYINTKFFHFMVGIKKISHNTTKSTFSHVPLLDLALPFTDEKLYSLFNLSVDEIDFIDKTIWPKVSKD
jgi:site-specific DNA-methyltransferase (adenine-specific)